jgi:transcriptional regulator with GAF, ATPase, and Fis domain
MPQSLRLTAEKQSEIMDFDFEQGNVGELPNLSKTEVVFLPPKSEEEDYMIVKNALSRLQESMSHTAKELGLKTDDDVFNYLNANKKFE